MRAPDPGRQGAQDRIGRRMKLSRRRFLTISAAFAAMPATAHAAHWQGRAFGADVSLTLRGPRDAAEVALREARALLVQIEALFSLYDPASALVALNRTGTLSRPDARFVELMEAADHAHGVTGGLFDPTVQPLWAALAGGQDADVARGLIGWERVRFDPSRIALGQGQALTFNGIAQGYATAEIDDELVARGLTDTLVNIGEHRGLGGPWTRGIEDPVHGRLGMRTITQGAIATSSATATMLGAGGHILHSHARPLWSTVSVEAARATVADSLSTAMVLATRDQIATITARADVHRVTLVDFEGNLTTI